MKNLIATLLLLVLASCGPAYADLHPRARCGEDDGNRAGILRRARRVKSLPVGRAVSIYELLGGGLRRLQSRLHHPPRVSGRAHG